MIFSSVWRPIHHPVEDAPLAFCDYRTISDDDLVASDRVSVQYNGEVYYLTYSDQQKWYFFSKQLPDEVAVFVSFDSDPGEDVECMRVAFQPQCTPLTFSQSALTHRSRIRWLLMMLRLDRAWKSERS
jgi:hypothetical protein